MIFLYLNCFKHVKMSALINNTLTSLVMYFEDFDDPEIVDDEVEELHEELTSFFDFIRTCSDKANEPRLLKLAISLPTF